MIQLRILGVPAPQGSKTAVVRGRHAVLIEGASKVGRAKHRAWRHAVAAEAEEHALRHGPAPDGPLRIQVLFVMPKPRSKPKKAVLVDVKPDLDKLLRSTFDGLADGGLVQHDQRIVSVDATKRYAAPGEATGALLEIVPAVPWWQNRELEAAADG